MRFGKIRVEDGELIFIRHMMINSLPVKDILWAYIEKKSPGQEDEKLVLSHELVIQTRRHKEYRFEMPEKEAASCIRLLKALNSDMASGLPAGGRIPLLSLYNTRDVGGLTTMDEKHIVPGKLIRSGDLYHISPHDERVLLEEYHLAKVIDLRSDREVERRPDVIMSGVEYYHIPVFDEEDYRGPLFGDIEEALDPSNVWTEEQLASTYENIVKDPYSVKQLARFMDILLKAEKGAVLWHGSTGKDRTGITTAIVLALLGVPRHIIMEDFLRSNNCMEEDMKHMYRLLESRPEDTVVQEQNLEFYYRVQENCLNRMFRAIDQKYGSIYQFFRRELFLGPKKAEELKGRYLL